MTVVMDAIVLIASDGMNPQGAGLLEAKPLRSSGKVLAHLHIERPERLERP